MIFVKKESDRAPFFVFTNALRIEAESTFGSVEEDVLKRIA